mgnify:CR=1 FL=1
MGGRRAGDNDGSSAAKVVVLVSVSVLNVLGCVTVANMFRRYRMRPVLRQRRLFTALSLH